MVDIDHPDYWRSQERTIFGKRVWQPMTLTEFLLARIDEDEVTARLAGRDEWGLEENWLGAFEWAGTVLTSERDMSPAQDELVTRFHPARVLSECAAKRVAVDFYLNDDDIVMHATIEAMAAVYADHPDFRPEWL